MHRFLKRLEKQSTTRSTKRSGATVYFLNNYNKYQRVSLLSEAGSEAASEASAKHARSEEEDTESIETEKETASAFEAFRKVAAFGRLPEPKTLSEQRRSKLLNLEGNFRDTPKSNGYQPSGPQQPYRPHRTPKSRRPKSASAKLPLSSGGDINEGGPASRHCLGHDDAGPNQH